MVTQLLAGIAVLLIGACSADPTAVATTSLAPSPLTVDVPSGTTTPTPDKSADTIKKFSSRMASGDPTAKDLTAPDTPVHLYAETTAEIVTTNPGVGTPAPIAKSGNGWSIGEGVVLTDFVMTQDGLIADVSRNGVPISTTVAPGDGTVYTHKATDSLENFTGQANVTIRAFRLFDNNLQAVIAVDNQSSADVRVGFDSYVADGVQYQQNFGDGADAGSATTPTVHRTAIVAVTAAPGGGLLTLNPIVDNYSSPDSEIKVTVTNLG